MENTALVRLFEILNAAEKRRIKKKLENTERKGVDMLLLFNYLDKNIKKTPKLDKELVYKAVFGKLKKLNDAKLTQLRYKLYCFIEDQIVIEQIVEANENKEHVIQKELILLDYFRDKVVPNNQRSVEGIAKLVESKMTDLERLIESTKVRDIYYYLNLFRLSHFLYYNLNANIRGEGKPYLDKLMKNLDVFYCLSKLRYSFELMQRQKTTNEKAFPAFLFNEVYKYSENLDEHEFPLISIYRLLADLSNELNEDKIIELKDKLFNNADKLGRSELMNSLIILLNLTTMKNNIDDLLKYEVNQFILKNKFCLVNGVVRPRFLVNCAINFVRSEKSEEIKTMLIEYGDHIPKIHREKTVKLCTAYQLFGSGLYEKCIQMIYRQPYHHFNLQAKILLLKSLYEIEFNLKKPTNILFSDVLDNYKRFVRRKKSVMNQSIFSGALNFAKCLIILTDRPNMDELAEFVNSVDFLVERRWLLEKIKKK